METWRDLVLLRWLTGTDGRPAFWKLAHLVNTALLGAVTYWCRHSLPECLPWLVSWAVLTIFGSHSVKGLQLYAAAKMQPTVSGNTTVTIDAAKLEAVRAARANGLYQDTP